MEQTWRRFLRLGIVHYMSYPSAASGEGDLTATLIPLLRDEFFDEIEVSWVRDDAERQRIKRLLESSGMPITYAAGLVTGVYKMSLNAFDPGERRSAIDQVKRCIDEAVELGAGRVSLVSGPDPGAARRAEATKLFVDSVQDICAYASERKLLIVMEPFDREIDRKALVGPCREVAAVVQQVRSKTPNFGIMYDQAHMPLLGETALDALTVLKDYLAHIHVGNAILRNPRHPYYGDRHPRFGAAGGETGIPELAAFLRALFSVGYLSHNPQGELPIVAMEIKPMEGEDPEVVLANSKRAWRTAWEMV